MSGNRTKQEYNGSGSSSSRPGAERSDGSRGFSSGAAGARGRGSGFRGRGRGGGGSGREAYHHQQQHDQQWMPPTGGSEWRGGRGRGKGNYHRNMSRSYNNDSRGGSGGSGSTTGNGSSGSAVLVPGSSIRGPRDGGSGGGGSSTSDSTSNSNSHRSNDYAHRSNYYAGRSPPPPPLPPPPPPRPAAAGATSTDGGGGSSSSSRNKRPAPASPSNEDDGDSGGRRRRRNQSKSARADSRKEGNAASTGAGSGGNGDKAGGEGTDVGSGGGGGGGGGGGSSKRARSSKGRSRSRQREGEGSGREGERKGSSGSANSVSDRRQAKLKELKVLDGRRKAAVAAGEALAKEVEKNRMEQDEIAIQIDAAKRLLALYDSNSDTPDVAILPSPPPPPAPAPAQAPRAEYSSTAAAASRSGSFSGAVRGRGGGSAAARGSRVSGSSPSLSAPAARSNGKASTRRAAGSGRKEDSSSSSSSSSDNDDEDYPLGSTRVGLPGGVGGEGFGLITSMPPAGGGSGSGSGSGGSSSRNGASRNAVAAASAAAASRKPPASVDAADEFPARVPSDGAGAGAGEGVLDSGGTGPGRTSGSGVGGGSSGGSRETTGVHRGVEVNRDSFNIVKQLMFQTARSRKPRTMAFNPVDPGLFAVCSADLSVDLWRYGRNKQELEKVSERNDVTPVGGAHMAWNPSGTHLAIGHSGSTLVNNWAATIIAKDGRRKSDMKLRSDRHNKPAQAVAWVTPSKNNQDHLVTGGEDGHVVIWTRVLDAESDLHKVAILHSRHTSAVRSACCPSISPTVVTGGADGRLVSYSIETASVQWEELLRVSKTYHPMVNELLEFPDNPHSLLVSTVDTAKSHSLFTMDTRQPTSLIHTARRMEWKRKDEKKSFSGLVYPSISPCGRYVACAGDWNGCFHIWDVRSARSEPMQSVLVNSVARVVHTAWHPDQDARALMSLSAASGQGGKNFALHLHGGLRS